MITDEQRLWLRVLLQGIRDHVLGRDLNWLGTSDFRVVCWWAGCDPDDIANWIDEGRFDRSAVSKRLQSVF